MDNKEKIKEILVESFIDSEDLNYDTPLISSGVLDSISMLQFIDKLEKVFEISFEAHEIDKDKFDSINLISTLVEEKKL